MCQGKLITQKNYKLHRVINLVEKNRMSASLSFNIIYNMLTSLFNTIKGANTEKNDIMGVIFTKLSTVDKESYLSLITSYGALIRDINSTCNHTLIKMGKNYETMNTNLLNEIVANLASTKNSFKDFGNRVEDLITKSHLLAKKIESYLNGQLDLFNVTEEKLALILNQTNQVLNNYSLLLHTENEIAEMLTELRLSIQKLRDETIENSLRIV